jgi:hypothetical protein
MDNDICVQCGKDLVYHHHRNLKCPGGLATVYLSKQRAEREGRLPLQPLPDGSGFFVAEIDTDAPPRTDPVYWNPYNKVVQDHRDGTIHREATDVARAERGLPVPWHPDMGEIETRQAPVF